jgi:hypothetical protein
MMSLVRRIGRSRWGVQFAALALALVVLLVLGVRTLAGGLAGTRSTAAPQAARTVAYTDVNPYGANFFLGREVEAWKLEKTVQMAAEAGIGWAKLHFPWEDIEPQRKGEFLNPITKADSWAKYDQIVALCEQYGIRIVARLDRPPDWTRQDNSYKERPPDDLADYGDFVYAFVEHYRGRIDYIQIWNEPNIFPEWGNRSVDPEGYVALLKVAYQRAKEANPDVVVLCAPLAITLGQPAPTAGEWTAMSDLDYLEAMYQAGAADYFDIYSANAFGMDRPPEDPADPNVLNFQRVLLQRQIMELHGDGDKAVWFNEYGWNAAPETFAADKLYWGRVSETQQAEYTLRGIELARREWPWAGVFMIWYFRQEGHIPADQADYYFRMVEPDFTPRPLYFAVQDATHPLQAAGPGTYQEASAGVQLYGRWRNVIDEAASGGNYTLADTPGSSLTFTFDGAAVNLLAVGGPEGGRMTVSLDGRPLNLPTAEGEGGTTVIDLYRPRAQSGLRIPLAEGLAPGTHVLRLTVADDADPSSTGRACTVDAFEVVDGSKASFPTLPLVGIGVSLALVVWLMARTWRHLRWALRRTL